MKYELSFDDVLPLVIVRVSGNASLAGFDSFMANLLGHPKWKRGMNVIIDSRLLEISSVRTPFIHSASDVVKHNSFQLGSGRCAVVTATAAGFGMARMWQTLTKDEVLLETKIFSSMEEAQAWASSSDCAEDRSACETGA